MKKFIFAFTLLVLSAVSSPAPSPSPYYVGRFKGPSEALTSDQNIIERNNDSTDPLLKWLHEDTEMNAYYPWVWHNGISVFGGGVFDSISVGDSLPLTVTPPLTASVSGGAMNLGIDTSGLGGGGGYSVSVTTNTTDNTLTPIWTNSIPGSNTYSIFGLITAAGPTNSYLAQKTAMFWRGATIVEKRGSNVVTEIKSGQTGGSTINAYFYTNANNSNIVCYVQGANHENMNWTFQAFTTMRTNGVAVGGGGGGGGGAYVLGNHVSANGTSGDTTTGSIDTTGAKLIVLCVVFSGGSLPTISDSAGNSWTSLTQNSGTPHIQYFYKIGPTTSGSDTFTAGAPASGCGISAVAFTGTGTAVLDVEAAGTSTGNWGSANLQTGSMTPATSSDVMLANVGFDVTTAGNVTVDSGFTAIESFTAGGGIAGQLAYKIKTDSTAENPGFTQIIPTGADASTAGNAWK